MGPWGYYGLGNLLMHSYNGARLGLLTKGKQTLNPTLPDTNMETQKDAYKDYSPFKRSYSGFRVSLGECIP